MLPVSVATVALPTAASATVATDSHSHAAAPVPAAGRCTQAGLPAFRARRGAAGAALLVIKVPRFTGRGRTEEQGCTPPRMNPLAPDRRSPPCSRAATGQGRTITTGKVANVARCRPTERSSTALASLGDYSVLVLRSNCGRALGDGLPVVRAVTADQGACAGSPALVGDRVNSRAMWTTVKGNTTPYPMMPMSRICM